MNLELDFEFLELQLLEPKQSDLKQFLPIFEQILKLNDIDGIMMIARNSDVDGIALKQTIEYLGEIE